MIFRKNSKMIDDQSDLTENNKINNINMGNTLNPSSSENQLIGRIFKQHVVK